MVSRLWHQLEGVGLVARSQNGKFTKITKLMEDGAGAPYRPPVGVADGPLQDIYFRLPFQYWADGLHRRLTLSGKAVLLICMSLRDPEFYIPDVFAGWYGLSPKTIRKGRQELVSAEVLTEAGYGLYIDTSLPALTATATKYAFQPPYDLNVSKRALTTAPADEAGLSTTATETATLAPSQDKPQLVGIEFLVRRSQGH
ncbi:hypothetical protein [Streptomyces mirabilis]|uniref:hypothetical protein n=1 Tax=Streptomyces mirabilis TaxID=68239 RepID=UPI0033A3C309